MFVWDDIAVFLALYRERTTGRAAAALKVSQPTVVRRIAALEHALGITLFERSPTGLNPTGAAERLLPIAERVERSICQFSGEVELLAETSLKRIRLTLLDHFEQVMIPVLRSFRARWPDVQTDLLPSDRMYDLMRGEADIAIRGRERPSEDELVVRELPPCGWAIYASAENWSEESSPCASEIGQHPLALLDGPPGRLPVYQWLESLVDADERVIRCSNFRSLASTIASGAAMSALPCTMGDADPQLVRCFAPLERFDVPIYLVGRRTILRRPAARDLFDSITAYFRENPALLMGKRGPGA